MTHAADQKARILSERARDLARPLETAEEERDHLKVLEFWLAQERYAIELGHIREVYPLRDLTPLPGVPEFVRGMVNVRGRILSIVDIGRFFELPRRGLTPLNRVIVLESKEMAFGILADKIVGTRSLSRRDIQPSLPTLTGVRAAYLKGVTADGVTILDGMRILSDERMVVK